MKRLGRRQAREGDAMSEETPIRKERTAVIGNAPEPT